jgi:hypothetical protein
VSDAVEVVESVASSIGSSAVSSVGSAVIGYIVMALAAVAAGVAFWIWSLVSQIDNLTLVVNEQKALVALKDAQISGFVGAIGRQNELIDKLAVDTKEGIDEMKKNAGKVETRYRDVQVPVKDASCEVKLKAYEDLLRVFAERGK